MSAGEAMNVVGRRTVLGGLALSLPVVALARDAPYDAVVAPSDRRGVPAGVRYSSLGAALAAAPAAAAQPFRLWIARGDWVGQVRVDAPRVELTGEDRFASRIVFTAASGMVAPDGRRYGTFRTPTLTVAAPGFRARNLTIANDFDGIGEMRKTGPRLLSDDPDGPQAVALMLGGASDDAMFERVDIYSHQDTLFADAGRSRFDDCLVTGSYDFVFGAGTAVFHRCEIRSRLRPDPTQRTGYIAAPSTLRTTPVGLLFDRCRLSRDPGVPDHSVYLGRPWRPSKRFADGRYGDPDAIGMAAYLDCRMDAHIAPAGWTEMWYTDRSGNSRHMLQPENARFAEFQGTGPGVGKVRRGTILTAEEAVRLRQGKPITVWAT